MMNGTRHPSIEMVHRLAAYFELNSADHQYLTQLVQAHKQTSNSMLRMSLIEIEESQFQNSAPLWIALVLKELQALAIETSLTHDDIREKLQISFSDEEMELAKNLLGKMQNKEEKVEWANADLKRFHQDCLHASSRAIALPAASRTLQTSFLRVAADQMQEAKTMIQEFQKTFGERFDQPTGTAVFLLNLHFFPISKSN